MSQCNPGAKGWNAFTLLWQEKEQVFYLLSQDLVRLKEKKFSKRKKENINDESTNHISLNFAKFVCSLNKPTLYVAINLELQRTSHNYSNIFLIGL